MKLVDFDALDKAIEYEHEHIDIKGAARNLRGLKQLMGPVTSVWSDFVLESAMRSGLTEDEKKALVREMEADIRRAVKKDKSKVVYGTIVAFVALKQWHLDDFAITYAQMIGLNMKKFLAYISNFQSTGEKVIRGFQVVYGKNEELAPIFAKLIPVAQANTFQRASRRRINFIIERLPRYISLFKQINNSKGGDNNDIRENI